MTGSDRRLCQRTVTAAVLVKNGKILIARRRAGDPLAGCWEFPGGTVESGESPEACLAREMKEEFDIDVAIGSFLGESFHHCDDGHIRLLFYRTFWTGGELASMVHDKVAWVTVEKLEHYAFAPADRHFAERCIKGEITL
ncbi:MAG: (deoxy)nucleoside triphosphate pyrophosphohydrolase [Deltaproteobacteria bacterium]|nr:(deoxy)nucleoside triphosphate pyrophosphohydrolase [Deltaproteobacteria bacterium]